MLPCKRELDCASMADEHMLTVEELNLMDDISGPALYRAEVRRIPHLTREEQEHYAVAARAGDSEARNGLVTNCLNWVMHKAYELYRDRAPSHSDLMDLIGHANVKMLEAIPQALSSRDPVAYLMSVGIREMRWYCTYNDPMIYRPRRDKVGTPPVGSLDADVTGRSLTDKGMLLVSDEEKERLNESAFKVVYDAIGQLSEQKRSIVMAYYGLSGQVTRQQHEIAQELGISTSMVGWHLAQLKRQLARSLAPDGQASTLSDTLCDPGEGMS